MSGNDHDVLVVGAGLFGLTAANLLAARGMRVAVLDKRNHLGGNAFSERDERTGIEVHRYGSHIFHTSNEEVWKYVNRFTSFERYEHRVMTRHRDEVYPMPVNLATINQLFRTAMTPAEARQAVRERAARACADGDDSFEGKALSLVGQELYEAFFQGYTQKQWQTHPRELPSQTLTRLPIRYNYDSRYFDDRYQGVPANGYGRWFENMVDSERIDVFLGVDFFDTGHHFSKNDVCGRLPVVYTGPVDEYFAFEHGRLAWRTLDFEWEVVPVADFQGVAVMNYADLDHPFTRIHEFRHLSPEQYRGLDSTVIAREFSRWAGEYDQPYYPVNTPSDRRRLMSYRERARSEPLVEFGGRLGSYQYLDMHAAVASALSRFGDGWPAASN